jgi:hypothetical protein
VHQSSPGNLPARSTLRKLGELALEVVKAGGLDDGASQQTGTAEVRRGCGRPWQAAAGRGIAFDAAERAQPRLVRGWSLTHVLPLLLPQELDLTGSRDFLTSESAKEALALLLAQGSKVKRVRRP